VLNQAAVGHHAQHLVNSVSGNGARAGAMFQPFAGMELRPQPVDDEPDVPAVSTLQVAAMALRFGAEQRRCQRPGDHAGEHRRA